MDSDLITLLADGEFHSGQQLGEQLGVSRAAVWKRLRKLEQVGLVCERVPGRGYRLPGGLDLLDAAVIRAGLSSGTALPVEVLESTGSTNSDLLERIGTGVELPRVLLAEHQHAGRGRRSRTWVSPWGRSLYLSLAWPFRGGAAQLEGLSLAVGTVIAEMLEARGLSDIGLKWPNDVLVGPRKLAGILIELAGDVDGDCTAVVGVGLNGDLGAHHDELIDQAWTDLRRELGHLPGRNALAADLVSRLATMLPAFEGDGFMNFRARWDRFDLCRGRSVVVQVGERDFAGRAEGVTATGALTVDLDGEYRQFHGGEVSLRWSGDESLRESE